MAPLIDHLFRRSAGRLVASLVGVFGPARLDLAEEVVQEALHRLAESPPDRLAGLTVQGVDRLDGTKLLFGEQGWLLFRRSGTEPVLRIYAEANSAGLLRRLLQEGGELLGAPGPG